MNLCPANQWCHVLLVIALQILCFVLLFFFDSLGFPRVMSPSNEARVLMLFECYNDKTSCNWNQTKVPVIIFLLLDYTSIVKVLSVYCKLWWLMLVNTVTHHLMRSAPMTSCIWYWSPSLQTLGHFLCSNSWKKKQSHFSVYVCDKTAALSFSHLTGMTLMLKTGTGALFLQNMLFLTLKHI